MKKTVLTLLVFCALLLPGSAAFAQTDNAADFFRGKTLRMLIGYGPGGGYDLYARLVAEFLPRFLPGNPTMVAQNMPGGGSFVVAKYMNEVAPKDGTVFGSVAQTLALDSMVGNAAKIDVSQFAYIGRVTTNIDTAVALPKSGIKSIEDVRRQAYNVGTSGGGSTSVIYPVALNTYGGTKFNLVRGYAGTTEIELAMERGEVDILPAYGLPGILVSQKGWIERGEVVFLYQAALKRHPLLPNVPTLPELGLTDDGREVLRAISSTAEIGRSIITTPGVPAERLAVLRAAFQTMLKDPTFLATCETRGLMVDGGSGEAMDAIVRDTLKMPPQLVKNVAQIMAN